MEVIKNLKMLEGDWDKLWAKFVNSDCLEKFHSQFRFLLVMQVSQHSPILAQNALPPTTPKTFLT